MLKKKRERLAQQENTRRHLRPRRFEGSVEVKEDELASVKVERQDFLLAVKEVVPAFGASTELVRGWDIGCLGK